METTEVVLLSVNGSHIDSGNGSENQQDSRKRRRADSSEEGDKITDGTGTKRARTEPSEDTNVVRDADVVMEDRPKLVYGADGRLLAGLDLAMTPGKKYSAQFVGNGTVYIEDLEVGSISDTGSTPSTGLKDYTLYSSATTMTTTGTGGGALFVTVNVPPNTLTKDGDHLIFKAMGNTAINANAKFVGMSILSTPMSSLATLFPNTTEWWHYEGWIYRVNDTTVKSGFTLLHDDTTQMTNAGATAGYTVPSLSAGFTVGFTCSQVVPIDVNLCALSIYVRRA
jgi:hypothetical protein